MIVIVFSFLASKIYLHWAALIGDGLEQRERERERDKELFYNTPAAWPAQSSGLSEANFLHLGSSE